jgi:hypothetical protein
MSVARRFGLLAGADPTAQQSELLVQAIDVRPKKEDFGRIGGLETIDQREPSQCSTSGVDMLPVLPTAQQSELRVQEIPLNELEVNPDGLGLAVIDHREPSHCSTSVLLKVPSLSLPTAQQSELRVQATALSPLKVEPEGSGLRTIDHFMPSQCSTRVLGILGILVSVPTAQQFEAPVHEIPDRLPMTWGAIEVYVNCGPLDAELVPA